MSDAASSPVEDRQPAPLPNHIIWQMRDHVQSTAPKLQKIEGVDDFEHGTYQPRPYYAFITSARTGQQYLVSDSGLRAELTYIPHTLHTNKDASGIPKNKGAKYKLSFVNAELAGRFENAVLSYNDELCAKDRYSFRVMGTGNYIYLPSGEHPEGDYVESEPLPSNTWRNAQVWNDVFVEKPSFAFDLLLRGWDLTQVDVQDFQKTTINKDIFLAPEGDSQDYTLHGKAVTPYGWLFNGHDQSTGNERSTLMSSSADVMNSLHKASGFNVSGGLSGSIGPVSISANFSVAQNQGVKDKIGRMSAKEVTHSEHTYVETEWAFVLDKRNIRLNDRDGAGAHKGESGGFRRAVWELQHELETARQKSPDATLTRERLERFIKSWGTHYAYAATFGAKGYALADYTKDQVKSLIENEVDIKKAWSASVSVNVFGFGGNAKYANDSQSSEAHNQALDRIRSETWETFTCIGGGSCEKGHPGPGARVPIYVDLRPLSELLGPPFYTDELTAITLREQLDAAIKAYAFVPASSLAPVREAVAAYEIEFGPVKIDVDRAFSALGEVSCDGPDLTLPSSSYYSVPGRPRPTVLSRSDAVHPFLEKGAQANPDRFGLKKDGGTKVVVIQGDKPLFFDFRVRFAATPRRASDITAVVASPAIPVMGGYYDGSASQQYVIDLNEPETTRVAQISTALPPHLRDPNLPAVVRCGDVTLSMTVRPLDLELLLMGDPAPYKVKLAERQFGWQTDASGNRVKSPAADPRLASKPGKG